MLRIGSGEGADSAFADAAMLSSFVRRFSLSMVVQKPASHRDKLGGVGGSRTQEPTPFNRLKDSAIAALHSRFQDSGHRNQPAQTQRGDEQRDCRHRKFLLAVEGIDQRRIEHHQ